MTARCLAALAALSLGALMLACGSNAPPEPEPCPEGVYPWCLDLLPQDADGGFTFDSGRDAP